MKIKEITFTVLMTAIITVLIFLIVERSTASVVESDNIEVDFIAITPQTGKWLEDVGVPIKKSNSGLYVILKPTILDVENGEFELLLQSENGPIQFGVTNENVVAWARMPKQPAKKLRAVQPIYPPQNEILKNHFNLF